MLQGKTRLFLSILVFVDTRLIRLLIIAFRLPNFEEESLSYSSIPLAFILVNLLSQWLTAAVTVKAVTVQAVTVRADMGQVEEVVEVTGQVEGVVEVMDLDLDLEE